MVVRQFDAAQLVGVTGNCVAMSAPFGARLDAFTSGVQ
jgi:hypothetical protein